MVSYNVILQRGFSNPYDVILRPGTVIPPPVIIPAVVGSVSYLFLFSSFAKGVGDAVIAKYYDPTSLINVGCNANVNVYDRDTTAIDSRWGLFITLPAPIIAELFNHPNLALLANSPQSIAHQSFVIRNNLAKAATSYLFIVNALGMFPLNLTMPN